MWDSVRKLLLSLALSCPNGSNGVCAGCWYCGDVDGSLCVDVEDLSIVIVNWGPYSADWEPYLHPDLNADGHVDVDDLVEVLLSFGCACPCD